MSKSKFSVLGLALLLIACEPSPKQNEIEAASFDALEWGIFEIKAAYENEELSVVAVTELYLNRISELNKKGPQLNAIISLNPQALEIADSLDQLLAQGKPIGPLHGIPVILKDNIESLDAMPTTAGSRALAANYVNRDSKVAERLRAAGALILAKANLSEWANFRGQNSISGWSGMGGFTRNPYVLSRNPCGSSAGSAVVVAAGLAPIAIGTETNGSIVCPSQTNGVVGLKPTVGLVAGQGIIPIAHSQDVAGPMAKTVAEVALVMEVLAEADPANPSQQVNWPPQEQDYELEENFNLEGKRIGVFTGPMGNIAGVDSLFLQAQKDFEKLGAELFQIPTILPSRTNYHSFQVLLHEYHTDLQAYFESLGPDAPIKSIEELIAFNESDSIELEYFNQAYLEEALKSNDEDAYLEHLSKMHSLSREQGIDRIMDSLKLDAIISMSGSPAWQTDPINGDNYSISSSSPAAIAGYPNLTVPMGFVRELPVGLAIFGRSLSEKDILNIGAAYEQETQHRKAPKFLKTDPELGF